MLGQEVFRCGRERLGARFDPSLSRPELLAAESEEPLAPRVSWGMHFARMNLGFISLMRSDST